MGREMTGRVVYRVESSDRRGPHWGTHRTTSWSCGCANNQPNRWNNREVGSVLFESNRSGRYACTSEAALCAWFNAEERGNLHELGYIVGVYMVRPGRAWEGNMQPDGARQIIFDAEIADRLDSISLLEIAA